MPYFQPFKILTCQIPTVQILNAFSCRVFGFWMNTANKSPFKNHVDCVIVLDEVVLLFDEEVIDAGDVDVHLAKPLVFLQERVKHLRGKSNKTLLQLLF